MVITQATNLTGSAAQRTATVVVTAENGTSTKTYTVVFSVESATPDFTLNASTTSLSIPQGAFGTTDISFTPSGGFSGTVALSIDAATPLPAGVTAQFTPASISSGSSTLRLDVDATAVPVGPITLTVKGVSGSITETIDISLTITEVTEPDFVLNATPQSIIISQGGGADINVTITALAGFSQDVELTASIVQFGLYANFSPNFVTGSGESLLTITADEDADLGAGELTITATSGSIVRTVSIALQVEPPPVVVIPANQFSPNGDGIDDTWQITDIEKAPQLAIMVFDRSGRLVFQTASYQNDWDGTHNGKQLLPTTYFYVIRNEKGENVESGSVNLIR
jgi:gliding motility-associated-like protein